MQLSAHFTLEEFVFSRTAARQDIDNHPGANEIGSLQDLCANVLEPLRTALGKSITVTSGYRSPRLNKAVGGAANSQHVQGRAADLICSGLDTSGLFKQIIQLDLPFDQLIYEGGRQSIWVHVSFDKNQRRGMIMKATFPPTGKTIYQRLTRADALKI